MRGHIISKIREASYFLKQMDKYAEKHEEFRFHLSAFLTSSRSAAPYVLEEAKKKQKKRWFNDYVRNTQFMEYFRGIRNFNIHKKNVPITRNVNLSISITDTDVIVDTKKEKKCFTPGPEDKEEKLKNDRKNIKIAEYPGEDILTLSTKYLEELKEFVVEAQNNNVI
jgi:hypothetical protein